MNFKKKSTENFNVSKLAIKYHKIIIAFWLAIAVAGIFAFSSLKYALFPDVTFPVLVISSQAKISDVVETETQLTKPIEIALRSLEEVDEIVSSSYPGNSAVSLLLYPGNELEKIRDRVDNLLKGVKLPQDATYELIPYNLNESNVITYAISSENKTFAESIAIVKEKIIPSLEKIKGVLKVNLLGEDSISDRDRLSNLFPTLVKINRQDGIALEVIKNSKANSLEVFELVRTKMLVWQKELPELTMIIAKTDADFIQEATRATINALLEAIALAIIVIYPFLRNILATAIAALAIPLSLLGTFIVMALLDFNLETITLLALALVIGIVVDDAIVDVENISRHIENGKNPREAAIIGTNEIGLAVLASTLTIVAVFLPVALMGGTIGQFFQPFGLTISAAVLISLLVSRTLSPVLCTYWLRIDRQKGMNDAQSIVKIGKIEQIYRSLLSYSLKHRRLVIALAIASFIGGIALIPLIPQGFIPRLDRGEFNVVYSTPLPKLFTSSNLSKTRRQSDRSKGEFDWLGDLAKSPEKILLKKTRTVGDELIASILENPNVSSVYNAIGTRGIPYKGKIYVKLKEDRQQTTVEVQQQVRNSLKTLDLKKVTISVEDIPFVDTEAEKPLQIAIQGENLDILNHTATEISARLSQLSGFVDVSTGDRHNKGDTFLEIQRLNGQRVIYISSNLTQEKAVGDATNEAIEIARALLPEGITLAKWGDSAQSEDVLTSFSSTLILSIVGIGIISLVLFGSFLETIAILCALPLSIVGAMLGLLITQSDFGIISLIGLILLVGLLNKNAILLIDRIKELRRQGKERTEAILETGITRLRPILMTTGSTILGMVPLALGFGAGAELRQPMAVAIIGGMCTSTLLSAIVVPVIYSLLDDAQKKFFPKKVD